jgi:hypothetical protein
MADFKKSTTAPQPGTAVEFSDRDDDFVPTTGFDQAPRLGSESIANFGAGPGVAPSNRKIH